MVPSFFEDYVSRSGHKLAAALDHFNVDVGGLVCADLGSHVGGFVDCLLHRGAARVYSVDTCYGTLAWRLRRDERVVVLERTNAMHVSLPEAVSLVTIDVGWTPQAKVLPNAAALLAGPEGPKSVPSHRTQGRVLTLIKPHYEALGEQLDSGVLPDEDVDRVVETVLEQVLRSGWSVLGTCPSPIRGHGGNAEVFALLSHEGHARG
jgi:23S rRNA (cytidine1920-2'-O)/16S rRNA (cytidine1409-2'-O)-methyltransferase